MMMTNTRVLLVQRPHGLPKATDFRIDQQKMNVVGRPLPQPAPPGGVILRTMYISIDPAMRGWMSTAKSYLPPVKLNDVMRASSIGIVIASDNNKFPIGTTVKLDIGGVQTYVEVPAKDTKFLMIVPSTSSDNNNNNNNVTSSSSSFPSSSSSSAYLGVLGNTGLTAYFGFFKIGLPQRGDTVLISGAAGATGSVVAQIAKNVMGCFVIGTAGSDEKCRWLETNGIVDVAINYKQQQRQQGGGKSLSHKIREALVAYKRNGADIVFDNVGGTFLEAALSNLSKGARIVLCGAISQYNSSSSGGGPRNYMNLLVKRASMKGFVVFDYRKEYGIAIKDLRSWILQGKLQYKEHIIDGIENFHPALMTLFDGTNKGKVILRVSSSSSSSPPPNEEEEEEEEAKNGNSDKIIKRSKL